MKNIASFLAFATALLLPISGLAITDAEVERFLLNLSKRTSSQLPMGNKASMLVNVVVGPGRRFTYLYVSGVPAREWTTEMKVHSKRIALNDYCTNPNMVVFRDYQVTVSWQHSDREGRHIMTNTATPGDCR